jgi:uncharacterized membrane protein
MVAREWVLRRNCSLTPRESGLAVLGICAFMLLLAMGFAMRGAWYVFWFAGAEALAVGVSFLLYARHATDRERIALGEDGLLIELVQMERVTRIRLDPRATRVDPPASDHPLIGLEANGAKVEVGRFLTEWKRLELARELRRALASQK